MDARNATAARRSGIASRGGFDADARQSGIAARRRIDAADRPARFGQARRGGWKSFEQRGEELDVAGEVNLGVERARETYALLKRGHLTGLSVGFNVANPERDIVRDHQSRRRIRKAVLRECSIVGFPATPGARITGVRSVDSWLAEHGLEAEALEELVAIVKADRQALPSDLTAVRSAWDDLVAQLKGRRI